MITRILPGSGPQPTTALTASATSDETRHDRRAIRLGVGLVALMLVIVGVAALSRQLASHMTIRMILELPTPLRAAHQLCDAGVISDRGHALYLDTAGDMPGSGDLVMADVTCVLHALHAPSHILDQIEGTRARHGQQSGHWAPAHMWGFSYVFWASWSYEPGSGLDIAITEEARVKLCRRDICLGHTTRYPTPGNNGSVSRQPTAANISSLTSKLE